MSDHGQLEHQPSSRCSECVKERREHRAEVAKLRHRLMARRLAPEKGKHDE